MKLQLLLAVALPLLGGGCTGPLTPALVGAGLGFGAASLNLDTEVLKVWDERNPPPNAPASPGQK